MLPVYEAKAESSKEVTIHFKRNDNNYEGYNIWAWPKDGEGAEYEFESTDDFGAVANFTITSSSDFDEVGFIIKKVEGDNIWAKKDFDADRFITEFTDGKAEIWVFSGEEQFTYEKGDGTIKPRISSASMVDLRTIKIETNIAFKDADTDKIQINDATIDSITVDNADFAKVAFLRFNEDLDITKTYNITFDGFEGRAVSYGAVLHSDSFNDKYATEETLGYKYSDKETTFKLWAPTAIKVDLLLEDETIPMTLGEKGVYSVVVEGDQHMKAYQYALEFGDGMKTTSADPYSFATTVNGEKTVIVSDDDLNKTKITKLDKEIDKHDMVIYEAHVRDLTIDPDNGIEHKGKFLGLTEKGTTTKEGNPSGLDYIKSLGVTHVQFIPIYDFASIDEAGDLGFNQQYNWGYDPQNYNVPEGSYSTDPHDPLARVHELKQMISTFHEEGLGVIMDVVYNHVFDVNNSPFHKTVPGYYFRYGANGNLLNGTGVGNETASEQPMMRRYIVESTKYWMEHYQLDGFRFDLMGIHDVETMKQVSQAVYEINPNAIILGEGWDMGTQPSNVKANQKNAYQLPNISFFNDSIRDGIKGSVFEGTQPGFINGSTTNGNEVYMNMIGGELLDSSKGKYDNPKQLIQYVEAHDNLTLYDKLLLTNPNDDEETRELRHNLSTAMVILSQGVPFIHAGQEMLRTKRGDHNSYISPDEVNVFDYDRAAEYSNSVEFFKQLIEFRNNQPLLRMADYETINKSVEKLVVEGQYIAYKLFDKNQEMIIAVNASDDNKSLSIDEGFTQVLKNTDFTEVEVSEDVTLEPLTLVVLSKGEPTAQSSITALPAPVIYMLSGLAGFGLAMFIITRKKKK